MREAVNLIRANLTKEKGRPAFAGHPLRNYSLVVARALTTTAATATEVAFAAASAATTATTAAESATTTAAEVTAGTFLTGTGFVDGQRTAVQFLAVEISHGFVGFFLSAHLDERKSAGLARELVHDEFATGDIAGLFEQVENVAFGRVKRQVAHE
jgi:hypothetical protein